MPFYWQTFKIILQVAIRRGPIGIAPSSSDRTIAGSIIIKNSIMAAKFLSSAYNSIILARTFASIPESVFLRFSFPDFPTSCREVQKQAVMAYLLSGSTVPYVLAGLTIFNFQGAMHLSIRLLKGIKELPYKCCRAVLKL